MNNNVRSKSIFGVRQLLLRRIYKPFAKDKKGVTAIEFAMVGVPFFTILFAIIEVGLVFLVNRMVDNAVISAARMIRTGQNQSESFSADNFAKQVCDHMPPFLCKPERFLVDVQSVDSFAKAPGADSLYDKDGNLKEKHSYQQSNAGDIVVVNVVYKWPMFTSVMNLNDMDHGNERHLSSTMVFRNEPWE
ncbi:MAG: TadE/TadG family type IV pilus assembly protein [Roseibium sp.]|uniref:TadE/TadG family type IV pilus assembly protein n=1 Tax=Parasphingorhabdus sp. TaxID=2709688 RepID=UPI0032979DC0